MAQVTVAFDAWKAGHVASTHYEVPVVAPKSGQKLVAVSSRLKQELIHPNRTSALVGLRFSTDGKRLIAGDYPGGVVVVWEVESGRELATIETGYGSRGSEKYLFLSPDWQTLFVSWEKKAKTEGLEKNGKRLVRWEFDGSVRAWDLTTGQLRKTFKHQPPRNILGMQLSPDGAKLVTFEELPGTYEHSPKRAASLWDVKTGEYCSLPDGLQFYTEFSPNGQVLASVAEGEDLYAQAVKLCDTATGREQLAIPIRDKNARLYISAFSPDGRLLVGDCRVFERAQKWDNWQGWLKWWDAATGREVASFSGGKNSGHESRFSPDGQVLAAVNRQWEKNTLEKNTLLLYRVPEQRLFRSVSLGESAKGERPVTTGPVFSPDGKWLALMTQMIPDQGSGDPDVRDVSQPRIHLIDVAAGEIRETLSAPQCLAWSACFSPDGRTLATSGHGRILLWDLAKLPGTTDRPPKP
jgi:WD40 repeat protein